MNVSALNAVSGLLKVCTALRAASRDLCSNSRLTDGPRVLVTFYRPTCWESQLYEEHSGTCVFDVCLTGYMVRLFSCNL